MLRFLDERGHRLLGLLPLVTGRLVSVDGWLRCRAVPRAIRAGRPLPANPMAHVAAGELVPCVLVALATVT